MDTTVKCFSNSQPGAPVVSRTAGTLIAMLDACLVDGFGLQSVTSIVVASNIATVTLPSTPSATRDGVMLISGATPAALNGEQKVLGVVGNTYTFATTGIADQTATGTITSKVAPAGWSKVFSGTNKAVYRSNNPASTQTYIRIDDSDVAFARPVGYLTMADVDTGTGNFGSAYFNRAQATAGNRNWWMNANDKFVQFGIDTHLSGRGYAVCAFGDIIPRRSGDPYCFIIAGANNVATIWSNASPQMSALLDPNGYALGATIARSYTQLGSGVAFYTSMAFASPGSTACATGGTTAPIQFPNGGDNSIILSDAYLIEANTKCMRGRIPGAYFTPQYIGGNLADGYRLSDMPDVPGKSLVWRPSGSVGAGFAGYAVDVTGPWE